MNKKMIFKSIAVAAFMAIGVTAANAQVGTGGLSDTSKVCSAQQLTLAGPTPTAPATYTYEWRDDANTVVGTTLNFVVLPINTTNNTGAPVIKTYKLTVTQTGGASCPSNVYTKVVIAYPPLTTTATPAQPFYCLGSPTNIVITAVTTAGAAQTPALNAGYGGLVYTWTPGTTPAAPAGTAAANVYTVTTFPTTAGTYTYNASVTYAQTLVGTTAGMAACTANSTANVVINNAPTVNSTTVTTTYQ
jgi:hypothetical protein